MKKFTTLLFSYILQIIISAFIIMPIYSDEQKDYSIEHLKKEEIGNYVIGSLDETDITPKTWKSVHLAVKQGESKSYISLLRPLSTGYNFHDHNRTKNRDIRKYCHQPY